MSGELFDVRGTLSGMLTLFDLWEIDIKEFKEHSFKTLADLWGEIQRHEIQLLFDTKKKTVTRTARSVKLLITTEDGGCFLETKRKYLSKGGKVILKRQPWSVSGTCLRIIDPKNPTVVAQPEDPIQTVIRETWEELRISIPREEIQSLSVLDEEDRHPSSVFHSFESHIFFRRYLWEAKRPLGRRMYAYKDNGVIAYVEYFSRWPRDVKEWIQVH
jgi:hypothetical protein